MRRPHVYERSAPRKGHHGSDDEGVRTSAARMLAAQLGNMVEKSKQAGLLTLSDLLEEARLNAERSAAEV